MTGRVSTLGGYQSALLNLNRAQARSADAQERISTEKVASDLAGYGRSTESLTALKSARARLQGFIDTSNAVSARLDTQALAFDRMGDATQAARNAIAEALAAGRAEGMMLAVEGAYQTVQDALNTKHQGRYVFSGGQADTRPVSADTLAQLAAAPLVADVFDNDQLKSASRIDESTTVQTGFLANELGSPVFAAFRAVQVFHAATPINGPLTDAQRDFLTQQLAAFDAAREGLISSGAHNGSLQNRVESLITAHSAQQDSLDNLVSDKVTADPAQAITDLQMSQVAVQAAAQVLISLRETSLLNLLR